MIIEQGDVVLVSHRRMFEGDATRFFVGRTIDSDGPLLKAEGFTFVRDLSNGHIVKKSEKRIKVLSIDSPGHIVYMLPRETDVDHTEIDGNGDEARLMDSERCLLDLSEKTHCGTF